MATSIIDKKKHGQVPAAIVRRNLVEGYIAFGIHIKGGHNYPYLKAPASDPTKWDDVNRKPVLTGGGEPVDPDYDPPYKTQPGLLDLYPGEDGAMELDMSATVRIGYEVLFVVLTRNPNFINFGDITEDNWTTYWQILDRFIPENAQILEYAEDYDGSIVGWPDAGKPPYDTSTKTYPAEAEHLWEDIVLDRGKHKWYRIKYLVRSTTDDSESIQQITPPIPIGEDSTTFVVERVLYMRQGEKGVDAPADVRPATPPAFTTGGLPNNNPTGWVLTAPASPTTQYLWAISGLEDLKSDINTQVGWSTPYIINEDNDLLRYSTTGIHDPNTIVPTNESVTDGTNEADLVAAGWVPPSEYNPDIHIYKAFRTEITTGTLWSEWKREVIGTAKKQTTTDKRYKLFPIFVDYDDPVWREANKPIGVDPTNQGWLRNLQVETNLLINFESDAEFFADNSFKQSWSYPIPKGSIPSIEDFIRIHPDNGSDVIDATREIDDTIIKRFVGGVETHDPEKLWLRANLFKGDLDLVSESTVLIEYQWALIYNNGQFLGTPIDLGTSRDIQVLHSDVDGKAIFKIVMTLKDAGGSTIIQDAIDAGVISTFPTFEEQMTIKDQVDGKDARIISVSPSKDSFLVVGTSAPYDWIPDPIIVRAETDNIDKNLVQWYYLNGSDPSVDTWVEITATTNGLTNPDHTYKNGNNDLVLRGGIEPNNTSLFDDLSLDTIWLRAFVPASGALPSTEDWTTITKVTQDSIAAGESAFRAFYDNPFYTIRVDAIGTPLATTEFTNMLVNIQAKKGSTVASYSEFTVTVVSVSGALSVIGDVILGNDGGSKRTVSLASSTTWDINQEKAYIRLNVTLDGESEQLVIGIGTILEPVGFTGLNIVSDRGTFTFDRSSGGRDTINLTANLTRHTPSGNDPVEGYLYEWKVLQGRYKTYGSGAVIASATTSTLAIDPGDLDGSAVYQCAAYLTKTGSAYDNPHYLDSVRINDQPDGSTKRLYSENDLTNKPAKPTLPYSSYPTSVWLTAPTTNTNWTSINDEGGIAGAWSDPIPVRGNKGDTGLTGATGATGAQGNKGDIGGIYGWTGSASIPTNTIPSGALVHTIGKIQDEGLSGIKVYIDHLDAETGARLMVGSTASNATLVDTFKGNNNIRQWRAFFIPVSQLPSETTNIKLYIYSPDGDGGTIYNIVVHAAYTAEKGDTGATGATGPQGIQGIQGITDGINKFQFRVSPITNLGLTSTNLRWEVIAKIDTNSTNLKQMMLRGTANIYGDSSDVPMLALAVKTGSLSEGGFDAAESEFDILVKGRYTASNSGVGTSSEPYIYTIATVYQFTERYIYLLARGINVSGNPDLKCVGGLLEAYWLS